MLQRICKLGWAIVLLLALSAAPASALSRGAANRAALKALHPGGAGPVVVYGLPHALKKGAVVAEAGPNSKAMRHAKHVTAGGEAAIRTPLSAVKLRGKAWLYWEDLRPRAYFMHPSVIVLIDDRTGHVVAKRPLVWWPTVNGRRPAFLASADAWTKPRYRVYSTLEAPGVGAFAAPAALAARASPPPARTAANGPPPLPNDCVVVLADKSDPIFKGDLDEMNNILVNELHLRRFDATGPADLDRVLTQMEQATPPCKDIVVYIAGHGWAARGSNYAAGPGLFVSESDHAQVTLKEKTAGGSVTSTTIDAGQLGPILSQHARRRGTTFKLVVDSCFSGRWRELANVPGIVVILTAARPDQVGFGYFQAGGNYHKASQKNAVVTQTTETVENTTVNPSKAGGFTNAVMLGLDRWAHDDAAQQATGGSLAKALVYNFNDNQLAFNYGYIVGWAIPAALDQTGDKIQNNPPPLPGAVPVASFTFSPDSPPDAPKAGQSVHFDASGSTGDIDEYKWTFSDGTVVTGKVVDHAFANPGIYEAHLQVTSVRGVTDVKAQQVFVSGPGTKPAAENDLPCDTLGVGVTVDIRIPSYAQSATASITVPPTCPGAVVTGFHVDRVAGNDIHELDEWGREKDHLHVTFTVTSTSNTGTGSYTVTASWQ